MNANTVKGIISKLPTQIMKKDGTPMKKYSFWIDNKLDTDYPNTIEFMLIGRGVENFPNVKIGDEVEVEFSLGGRRWEGRVFNEAISWTVRPVQTMDKALQDAVKKDAETTIDDDQDLPF